MKSGRARFSYREVVEACQPAWHEIGGYRYLYDGDSGNVWFGGPIDWPGAYPWRLSDPDQQAPAHGWRHELGCPCWRCAGSRLRTQSWGGEVSGYLYPQQGSGGAGSREAAGVSGTPRLRDRVQRATSHAPRRWPRSHRFVETMLKSRFGSSRAPLSRRAMQHSKPRDRSCRTVSASAPPCPPGWLRAMPRRCLGQCGAAVIPTLPPPRATTAMPLSSRCQR